MRALVFNQTLSFQPRHPEPAVGQGDTLVRVRQAGICGTDLEIVKGYLSFAGVPGREFVGDVVSSPDKDLVGRRVVGEVNIVCGRCDLCQSGLSNHCRSRAVLGMANHDGSFADFLRLPAINLHVVPDSVDDDAAVFAQPLAAAMQVLKQIKLDGRKWVTVLGDGRLGLLVAQVLRNVDCPVRVIGKHAGKLTICEKWGIRSRPLADIVGRHDQDVVIDCSGSGDGFEMAMQMVRPRGTIVLKSLGAPDRPVNLSPLVTDEINVIGSRDGSIREALMALANKSVDVVSLITRRMRLEQGVEAMAYAARPDVLKVILKMD
jgi:threonine dehydrogenase-like Zn-dependent dehydrogenase